MNKYNKNGVNKYTMHKIERINKMDKQEIEQLTATYSVAEIAKMAGKCPSTIYRILHKHNINTPSPKSKMVERNYTIATLRKKGLTLTEIAKMYNISKQRVLEIVNKYPIEVDSE